MTEKLRIAKYNGNIIDITEYHDSIHKGNIYCPFCNNPPLKLVHVVDGFFRAWPNQGGHNCGKKAVKIFDADWKGKEITNVIRRQDSTLEVVIDIFQLAHRFSNGESQYQNLGKSNRGNKEYSRYEYHKEVFRDVVRSVYQMKQLLKQNEIDSLKEINFRFKTENEIVPLDEVVKVIDELDTNLINKSRFVVFKVESTRLSSDKTMFINAYRTNSKDLSIVFRYPDKSNKFKKLENGYAIAYGNISYSRGKFFVNIVNDFHIQSLDEDSGKAFFKGKELEKYNKKNVISDTGDSGIHKELIKVDLQRNDINNYLPSKKEINSAIQSESEALVADNKGLSMHVSKTEFVLNKTQEISDKNAEYEKVSIIKKVVNSIFLLLKKNN